MVRGLALLTHKQRFDALANRIIFEYQTMLQDIRANSQGTIAKIIIGLIVISFSIFGIESLLFSGGDNGVAEVNGDTISPFALQQEVTLAQRQLLGMLGENADPALLDQDRLSQQALQSLIQRTVLSQASSEMGLSAPDTLLGEIIGGLEQFQIDGQFSRDMYQSSLASAGFTPQLFQDRLAVDVRIGQLRAGLAGSDFSTPAELISAAEIAFEGRDVRYISIPTLDFMARVAVTDEEISEYYEANTERYTTDEQLVVEYLELRQENYFQPIAEDRLREEFELSREEFSIATESRVSHILLEGELAELGELVSEIQSSLASERDFADVAEQYSTDIGSASVGGDLGYTAGDTFPEPMEDAIAQLSVGEVSEPVVTQAGVHIIKLTDRREGSDVVFEDVAAEIERSLQASDAAAALLRDVESLRDSVFNAADLSGPAAELGLEVLRSDPFSNSNAAGLFANPTVLDAAFSEDVLTEGHNSEVLELSPEEFLVLRVAERQPPRVESLEEVYEEVQASLQLQATVAAARSTAEELLVKLNSGASVESAANEAGFEWQVELNALRSSPLLPVPVRKAVFALPAPMDGEPRRRIVEGTQDIVYVVELDRVISGQLAAATVDQAKQLRDRIAGEAGGVVQQQFESNLRAESDVTIF
ncbi:MAG: SurA N-terminal domain-containing protein [Pseudomonadota bacterium]